MEDVSSGKLKKLRDFINMKFGIYIDDDKLLSMYKKKFSKLMEQFDYKDFSSFHRDIVFNKNSELVKELISTVTVNETYFFREKHQFDTLINYVLPELDRIRPSSESINILSAPCSTGEEVYSIAIYLLEEGNLIKKRNFLLLGIDIDSEAIRKAREGLYPERSLIKLPENIIKKYFRKEGNLYRISDFLRRSVNFRVVNVLDKYAMKRLGKFDVIFSRNLLIYFDERNRREALSIYYSILKDGGYLFLGHAERVPDDFTLFEKIKLGESYIYRKAEVKDG
ncbi:chemotaxis protein methyltransferase CheR [Persephonella hydrogeniphila]|uniref:protein-glutamate O-methyltransferase n=1 Tax=Persephonella hydrogeniphila TaxID=198703 RepID=A0A285NR82_9AQUI|nr:CheR family methyltransferase [Persephonella hydrogeniphila]SNZ10131.1 chemotaxis protein methyltransferase CheR [Persephonella hydrogeniphila]